MSNTLPATFEQRVKERISETIADLVPAEDLARLVAAQVAHFQGKELPELIKKEIHAQLAAAIRAEFSKPEYLGMWANNGTLGASEAVKEVITANMGAVLTSLVGGMVQMTVQQMQSNMPRAY